MRLSFHAHLAENLGQNQPKFNCMRRIQFFGPRKSKAWYFVGTLSGREGTVFVL